jgi:hypothetical protein
MATALKDEEIKHDTVIRLEQLDLLVYGIKLVQIWTYWIILRLASLPPLTVFLYATRPRLVHLNTAFFVREPHFLHAVPLTLLPQIKHV